MASFWALIQLINKLWDAIATFLGFVKSVKHENDKKEISKEVEVISKPESTEEERREATKHLEDDINKHT